MFTIIRQLLDIILLVKKAIKNTELVRNYSIDALRFIAVCFVVYIHIFAINQSFVFSNSFSWKITDVLFGLSRLAVPIFFAISGWFIFSRNRTNQIEKLQKQIPRLIKLLIMATIGTGLSLWILAKLHLVVIPFDYFPQIKGLFEMFIFGKSPTIAPLWFLVSLIIVEILYWLVSLKSKRDNWLIVVAVIFLGINLAFTTYRPVTGFPELSFSMTETWFMGFVWFSLGYFLAKFYKEGQIALNAKSITSFTITVGVLYLYEYILHTSGAPFVLGPYNYSAIFIFTPFITAGILLFAAHSKKDGKIIRTLARFGKDYSLGIFIIHLVVMQPINALFVRSGLLQGSPTMKLVLTYSSVVLISLGLTAAYYKTKTKLQR